MVTHSNVYTALQRDFDSFIDPRLLDSSAYLSSTGDSLTSSSSPYTTTLPAHKTQPTDHTDYLPAADLNLTLLQYFNTNGHRENSLHYDITAADALPSLQEQSLNPVQDQTSYTPDHSGLPGHVGISKWPHPAPRAQFAINQKQKPSKHEKDVHIESSLPEVVPKRYNKRFTSQEVKPLLRWYEEHIDNPYPVEKEIIVLSSESGLSGRQVRTWFTNQRARCRQGILRHLTQI
jgi:Homeodomain